MATPKAQRTWTPRGGEVNRAWRVVDAEGKSLGRLASEVAQYLRGKHLPTFAEHMDTGDFVIVLNARRIRLTGNKLRQKMYYRHSGYPGGFKAVALGDMLERHPDRVVKHAVKGMLPHNALGRKILRKLKVYDGPSHPHAGQLNPGTKAQRDAAAPRLTAPSAPSAPSAPDTSTAPAAPAQAEPVTTASTEEQTA